MSGLVSNDSDDLTRLAQCLRQTADDVQSKLDQHRRDSTSLIGSGCLPEECADAHGFLTDVIARELDAIHDLLSSSHLGVTQAARRWAEVDSSAASAIGREQA